MRPSGGSEIPLGRTQVLVMRLLALAEHPKSVRALAYDWPTLTESSVRSALDGLWRRGLVDAAGWEAGGGRKYVLTTKGALAEAAMLGEDLDE
jgi:hypothetical protein